MAVLWIILVVAMLAGMRIFELIEHLKPVQVG
jgi:hypothetical protein